MKKTEDRNRKSEGRFFCFLSSVLCPLLSVLFLLSSCAKPMVVAKPKALKMQSRTFLHEPNDVYQALQWAMKTNGYPVDVDDKQSGYVTSRWVPTKSDSHYMSVFGRKDYGANGAYYRLEINIAPEGGETRVEITSNIQAVVTDMHSSGREEKMILDKISDYFREAGTQVTNVGLQNEGL